MRVVFITMINWSKECIAREFKIDYCTDVLMESGKRMSRLATKDGTVGLQKIKSKFLL